MENNNSTENTAGSRFNRVIAIIIAVVSLITAFITFLQSDASARDGQADRDGMRYALEAFGQEVSGDARVNYDYNVAYQALYEYSLLADSATNREDTAAATRYNQLFDETLNLSPMLQAPYYDPQSADEPAVSQYESDVYLVSITTLMENFKAASNVKSDWDTKANTYIIHITLLAVSLFMFGLSTTLSGKITRWIFTGTGIGFSLVAVIWAATLWAKPVFDLRQQGTAIQDYAQGIGLAYQDKYTEAISAFDKAIQQYPQYSSALTSRAESYLALEKYTEAATDYETAVSSGDNSAETLGMLAYVYHLQGDFEKAAATDKQGLEASPDENWVRFDYALNLLASGNIDQALAEYGQTMKAITQQVEQAHQNNAEPPSYLWAALDDASNSLDQLLFSLENDGEVPPAAKIIDPEKVKEAGETLLYQIKSLSVALEYTAKAPEANAIGTISAFSFTQPIRDEETGEVIDYSDPTDIFSYGIDEFSVLFDYDAIPDGSEYLFKLYINGEEDPSWRLDGQWDLGSAGSAEIPLSYAYSDTFVFEPGEYTVELYINYQLAQRGYFSIQE